MIKKGKHNITPRIWYKTIWLTLLWSTIWITQSNVIKTASSQENEVQKVFAADGRLEAEIAIQDGQMHGPAKFYAADGSYVEGNLKNGVQHGEFISYRPDGKLMQKQNFKDGQLHGTETAFYSNGRPIFEKQYQKGVFQGIAKFYWKNGKLSEEISYINGQRSGPFKGYYFDGVPREEVEYVNDKLNGPYKGFYPDGKIQIEAVFSDNQLAGQTIFYDTQGQTINADSQLQQGLRLIESGEYLKAAQLFHNFVSVEYFTPEAFYYKAYAHSHVNWLDEVIDFYQSSLDKDLQSPEFINMTKIVMDNRDIIERAIKDLGVAVMLNDNYTDAYQHRLLLNVMLNNQEAARADARILDHFGTTPNYWYIRQLSN